MSIWRAPSTTEIQSYIYKGVLYVSLSHTHTHTAFFFQLLDTFFCSYSLQDILFMKEWDVTKVNEVVKKRFFFFVFSPIDILFVSIIEEFSRQSISNIQSSVSLTLWDGRKFGYILHIYIYSRHSLSLFLSLSPVFCSPTSYADAFRVSALLPLIFLLRGLKNENRFFPSPLHHLSFLLILVRLCV